MGSWRKLTSLAKLLLKAMHAGWLTRSSSTETFSGPGKEGTSFSSSDSGFSGSSSVSSSRLRMSTTDSSSPTMGRALIALCKTPAALCDRIKMCKVSLWCNYIIHIHEYQQNMSTNERYILYTDGWHVITVHWI